MQWLLISLFFLSFFDVVIIFTLYFHYFSDYFSLFQHHQMYGLFCWIWSLNHTGWCNSHTSKRFHFQFAKFHELPVSMQKYFVVALHPKLRSCKFWDKICTHFSSLRPRTDLPSWNFVDKSTALGFCVLKWPGRTGHISDPC